MDNIREFVGNEEDYDMRYYKSQHGEEPEALMDEMEDEDQYHQEQQYESEDDMDQDGEYDEEVMEDDVNNQLLSDQMDEMEMYDDEEEYEEEEDEQNQESSNASARDAIDMSGTGSFVPPDGMEMEDIDD